MTKNYHWLNKADEEWLKGIAYDYTDDILKWVDTLLMKHRESIPKKDRLYDLSFKK